MSDSLTNRLPVLMNISALLLLTALCLIPACSPPHPVPEIRPTTPAQEMDRAVYNGERSKVESLLRQDPSLANSKGYNGEPPLHRAVSGGHKAIVKMLIDSKADINGRDEYGYTPLHWAASTGSVDTMKTLISSGADLNMKDNKGRTPLKLAGEYNNEEAVKFLRSRGAKE
ncbi:MAG: ankyrin repeat domain-containing protein [Candidatus Xenobiia bacterium LiM19]